jgi:hypothetical protein
MAVINNHVTQTVNQKPTIDATFDMQVLTDAPLDAPLDAFGQSESFLLLWQTLTQLLGSGGLQKDHPSLIALVDVLKQQGVLPSSGTLTAEHLTTFHQWFQGLETDQFSDSMTYLEGLILYQWNESLPSPMLDQVIVFDALNAFNQYAIYCQVIVGDEVVTLNYQEASPIQYDESQHGSFGILLNHQWVDSVDSAPVNYATAHTILDLSPEDRLALGEWLATVFPNGWDHLSDEDMIMAVYTQLLSDEFEYQPEIGDQWASVSQFLDSKKGDCEEFSHLFYSALQVLFESSEQPPTVQVLAGLVGSGIQTYGHSVVQLTRGDTSVVIDLTGEKTPATSLRDFPTLGAYIEAQSFDEMLRYDHAQTTLNVAAPALRNFSTASSMDDQLELQFKAVFGDDSSFQSVTSTSDADYTIDGYDSLIKKVIGLEMVRLLESGQMNGTNVVLMRELSAFEYVHAYQPSDDIGLTPSQIYKINAVLRERIANSLTRSDLSFLNEDEYSRVLEELKDRSLVLELGNDNEGYEYPVVDIVPSDEQGGVFEKLIELGFISSSGLIDPSALNDQTKIRALRSFYTVNGHVIPVADELLAFLRERTYVYADVASVGSSDPFESALLQFEQLSEELFHGLTASTTPIYAAPEVNGRELFSLSAFVVDNGYVEGGENSLFIRIDHQKLQQTMALFYALQNTISAFMTIAFSISDMVSSISAKLGEDNATSSSTAKQRQKIMQVVNSYAGGISESLNSLTDVFNQSVQKTNESRYQTAISQIDFEYSDFGTQLGDAFLAKTHSIRKENLKVELSQDYYRMLRDNRQSMQRAMIDVPNFGPNIMPSMFSHFFINAPDQYHGLTSMQIWSALYAHGVIDEYGLLKSDVDLETTSMIDLSDALPVISLSIYPLPPESEFIEHQTELDAILQDRVANPIEPSHFTFLTSDDERQALLEECINLGYITNVLGESIVRTGVHLDATSLSEAQRMNGLLHEQFAQFKDHWVQLSVDEKDYFLTAIRELLRNHQRRIPPTATSTGDGMRIVHAGMGTFDTSRYLFSVMDLMERESDSTHAMNALFEYDFFSDGFSINAVHNTYGSNMVSEESLQKYELYELYRFPMPETSDFFNHRDFIDALLQDRIADDINPSHFSFIASDNQQALFNELKDMGYIRVVGGEFTVPDPTSLDLTSYRLPPGSQFSEHQTDLEDILQENIANAIEPSHFTFLTSDEEKRDLFEQLKSLGYVDEVNGAFIVRDIHNQGVVHKADIMDALIQNGVIDASGNIIDAEKLAPGQTERQAIDRLFSRALQGSQNGELLYQDLRSRQHPDALHLTSSASAPGETGSGFQVLDADMVNLARKNFMLMNLVRRVYMSLVSAQTQFFERIASKLSKDATSSSHYGDMQSSLMESHMGIAERQLSAIQSDTMQMVSRINDLHKMRLNIIKMGDPALRGLDMASTWAGLLGAVLMLAPTPITHFIGIFLTMASQVLSLGESWRGWVLEDSLHQRMDESAEMSQLNDQVRGFFQSNLQTGTPQDSSLTTHAGAAGVSTDVIPRSVVDYANAHLYINPDSTHVQQLLHDSVFPNGVPTRSEDIIRGVHAFIIQNTTYSSDDPSGDDWASVDDTAQTLSGDCEDLVNLEHSLLLAAFQASGGGHQQPTSHAAYVQVEGQSEPVGHVYLTIDLAGETVVLDPSLETDDKLETDNNILTLDEYKNKYKVEDVVTYTDQRTNVLNAEALGIQTSGFLSDVADGFFGVFGGALSEVFGTLFPDDFIEMFIPDVSDGSVFDGRFEFDQGASDDEIIRTLTADTLDIMFDTFMGNAGQDNNPIAEFFGDMTAGAFRLVMEPLILSFAPGSTGHDISTSVMNELTTIAERVLGDAFTPDPEQIEQTLTNRYLGTQHSPGITGDTSDEILSNLQEQIGTDFHANNVHVMPQYQFQLSRDSSFYRHQPQIDALLQDRVACAIEPSDFDFLDSDEEKLEVFEELKNLGYIVPVGDDFVVKDLTQPQVPPSARYPLDSNSEFIDYQAQLDVILHKKAALPIEKSDFTFLTSDVEKQDLLEECITLGYITNVPGANVVRDMPFQSSYGQQPHAASLSSPTFSTSLGGAPPTLSTDHTSMIHSLFEGQEQLTTGFFAQNISPSQRGVSLNNQFFSADEKQKRVMLNQYNVDQYKDGLRIVQEQLRFVFLLVKAVSDHLATLAANIGDDNKVKVAAGLQKIFETSFGLVNNDIQLREHLLNHYASAVNHNFEVDKIRYERLVDSSFKTATFLPVMLFPMYGQMIDSAISIFQTMAMYYELNGVIDNPYSDIHLHGDYFNDEGYVQGVALQRYALSTTDAQTRSDLTSNPANQVRLQSNGQVHPQTLNAVVNFRQESFHILKEASQIPPKEQGVRLSLSWVKHHRGEEVTLKSVDYDAFNQKRNELIRLGMQAQSSLVMFMSLTGFLSSLTKAIRGDGKVGAQQLSDMIDVIEREVMHDIDALDAIQSMQESAVSFNNRHFESLKRVERVWYEAIFFATYFSLSKFIPISAWGIITVKALSNMFQGIMLSYFNFDNGVVENELDDDEYYRKEHNSVPDNANVRASAYGENGQASTIDYSGIRNYENNYLAFSNDQSRMILDDGYANNGLFNAFGLGFKSVNWFEFAYQNIMLKKLFTQWSLMLKQGQTVAEAYQNIADELGASVSTLSYSRFLKSQMNMKKTGMMKNLSNRFSAAGEVVGVFNAIQAERFETFQQFVKVMGIRAFKWWLGARQKIRDKKMSVLTSDTPSGKKTFLTKDFKLTWVAILGEDILRVVAGGARSVQLSNRRERLMQDAEQQYLHGTSQHAPLAAGSQAEAMLYASNIKKAKQKVNADIILKLTYYQGLFKAVIKNFIDEWSKRAKAIGNQQVKGDASFVKDQSQSFSSALMSGDHAAAQRKLTEISAYLMDGQDSYKVKGVLGLAGNLWRSIKSTLTRDDANGYVGTIGQLEANNGVWTSIRRSHKQMVRYGGQERAGQFGREVQDLKEDIQHLHEINTARSESAVPVSMDQLLLLQRISTRLRTLDQMMAAYDDYRQSPKNGKFRSDANIIKRIFQSQYGQLGVIAANVESFALHGTVSTVVSLNKYTTQRQKADAQQLFQAMTWLTDLAEKDSRRVYQSIGDMLTQLSHKKDEQSQLARFLESSLKDYPSMERNAFMQMQRDFVKHVLACQQGGFKLIMDLLKNNHNDQQLIDLLSNGSDGVVDLALKMGNGIGAKRLLYAMSYSDRSEPIGSFCYGSHKSSTGINALKEWMLTPEKSKHLAALLVKTQHVDELQTHDLTDGAWFTKNSWSQMLGWRRHYPERLERAIKLARQDIAGLEHDSPKSKAFNDFYRALHAGSSSLIPNETAFGDVSTPDLPKENMATFENTQNVDESNIDRALQWKLNESQTNNNWFQAVYDNHPRAFISAVLRLSNKDDRQGIIEHIQMRDDATSTEQLQLHIIAENHLFNLNNEAHLGEVEWEKIDWSGLDSSDTHGFINEQKRHALKEWLLKGLFFDKMGEAIDRKKARKFNENRQKMLQYIPGRVLKALPSPQSGQSDAQPGQATLSASFITDALTYQPDLAVFLLNQHPECIQNLSEAQIHRLADVTAWVSDPNEVPKLYNKMLEADSQNRDGISSTSVAYQYIQSLLLFHPNGFESLVMHMNDVTRDATLQLMEKIIADDQTNLPKIPDQALEKAMFGLAGHSLAAYDALSLSQRTELLSLASKDLNAPTIKDCLRIKSTPDLQVERIQNDNEAQKIKASLAHERQMLQESVLFNTKSRYGGLGKQQTLSQRIDQNQLRLFNYEELQPCLKQPPTGFDAGSQLWLTGVCQSLVDLKNKESAHGMNGVLIHQKAHDFFTKHQGTIKPLLERQPPNQNVADALWHFAPRVAAECLPNDDQARRMSDRVQHLVADAMLRQQGREYRPVSEITTQFSLIPEGDATNPLQTQVFLKMMDQFTSLSAHHSLASGARMFDVVDAIVSSEMRPTIQLASDQANITNTEHSNVQGLEVLQSVQKFLGALIDNGVVLNEQQQQRFLALLDQCSSEFQRVDYGYNKTNGHAFASKMHGIERIVGLTGIQTYLATKYERMSQYNLFLKSLSQRIDLAVQAPTGDSADPSTPDGIIKIRQFRQEETQFFNPQDFVSNMTALHQFSPGDFNEACVALGRLDSPNRGKIIDKLVEKISGECNDNQAKMMHELLVSMHEDHRHPDFLRDFMAKLNIRSNFTTNSELLSGNFGKFLIRVPLADDRLTSLQSYFVAQCRVGFYESKQFIRNNTKTPEKYALQNVGSPFVSKYSLRALNKEAVSNLIQCVVQSGIPKKKSAGWMMVAQLLSEHEGNQTRAQKAQLVQYVIHELMKHSNENNLNANIHCLLKHVPSSNQEGVRAEISHYFKGKTFVKPTNFKFKEVEFRDKPVVRPTWGSASRGMSQFFGREHTTTSYSSDPNHPQYQNLLGQTIDAINNPASHENKAADERLLAHLMIQAASHEGSESQLDSYIEGLTDPQKIALAKECELLISDSQLASLKNIYTDGAFGDFVQKMCLTGAKQTHARAQLLKATMIQKIKTDDAMLTLIFDVLTDYANYNRNFENGPRTASFSVADVNASLSIGG